MKEHGYTLFELLLTIGLAAVLMTLAAPSFSSLLQRAQLETASDQVYSSLWFARSQAISRQHSVVMAAEPSGWRSGWQIFVDINGDGLQQDSEPIIQRTNAQPAANLLTTNLGLGQAVYYQPDGRTRRPSGSLQMGTFTLCRAPGGLHAGLHHRVVINAAGRPRIERSIPGQGYTPC